VRLREFQDSDIPRISAIWEKHHSTDHSLPDRQNSIVDAVVEDDAGNIVAYGQVKLFAEAMLFLDFDSSKLAQGEAIKLLMQEAFRGTREFRLKDIYAFIKDPAFADLIERHFGFQRTAYPGELLLRRLD